MILEKFEIGFWHPFGPHAGETPEEIIKRKNEEIKKNGWTLWSFQYRKTLGLWYQEIKKIKPNGVFVFCSEGVGARDPMRIPKYCTHYLPANETIIKKIPKEIKIPHPLGDGTKGSAFIVKDIIYPVEYKATSIEWLKDGKWQTTPLPTRPEYLIRLGLGLPMRKFRAILILKAPYLAEISV
ncbi:MAG: hypothetical protein WC475_02590 [Candidatus Paceibacterota bacterium]